MNMIPKTIHGMSPHDCISSMQKFIRRGMEREAMEMACEMGHTSRNYASWCTNRLQIISHEDIGLACPNIIPLVRSAMVRPPSSRNGRSAAGTVY